VERLTLYTRLGCGLCEAMEEELRPLASGPQPFQIDEIDVDSDPELRQRYGHWVPVLMGERGEICHYFLDPDALERYFAGG